MLNQLETKTTRSSRWMLAIGALLLLSAALVLSGCQSQGDAQTPVAEASEGEMEMSSDTEMEAADHAGHAMVSEEDAKPEYDQPSPVELNVSRGAEIGKVYEAFLSPQQEGDDESDTPAMAPEVFKSSKPGVPREERPSRGHGVLSFTNDLSRAYVHMEVSGVILEDVEMFHIHCGRPGQLGPIIVDFALVGDVNSYFEDGVFTMEITNEMIDATVDHGDGLLGLATAGCPITAALPTDKVKTIAGMELIAQQGELYFNLHTSGQLFFGDIRGQLYPVE